jgi:hypothetical protein
MDQKEQRIPVAHYDSKAPLFTTYLGIRGGCVDRICFHRSPGSDPSLWDYCYSMERNWVGRSRGA